MIPVSKFSPHHSARPVHMPISCIVLHSDAGKSAEGTIGWLADPTSRVSYHYLVGRTGNVYQFVDENRKAWHSGLSEFQGVKLCNNYSIGCAFANRNDGEAYTDEALNAMAELCRGIMERHPAITLDRITTHAIVSPTRKTDPSYPFILGEFLALVEGTPPQE